VSALAARSKLLRIPDEAPRQKAKAKLPTLALTSAAEAREVDQKLLRATSGARRVPVLPTGEPIEQGPQQWVPEQYQLEGVKFLLEHACACLMLDPGYRKTSIVLGALRLLFKKKVATRVLVVAPPRVSKSVWPNEVKKWADFNHLRTVHLHGLKKDRLLEQDADIYIVNFEGLEWLFGVTKVKSPKTGKVSIKLNLAKFKQLGANVLIVDEISKVRNANALRSKILHAVRDAFDRIIGMTGSPAPRSLLDLFGVMKLVDGGYSLGQYITHYRSAYFVPDGFGGFDWKLQEGGKERIYERIAPFVYRPGKQATLQLPELVTNVVTVDLPDDARKIYDALEDDFIAKFDDLGPLAVVAANSGSAYVKCCQVANGGLYLPKAIGLDGELIKGKREWKDLHFEKTDAVVDLVEELNGQPALIVYDFEHDLGRLQRALGKDFPHIGGGVTLAKGDKLVEAWNRGHLPGLLVHPASVAHGLNMQEGNAQHVINHSITDDYELYDQIVRRLLRSGNTSSHVFSHLIVAKDTVDEVKVTRLRRKKGTQDNLLEAMEIYTAARRKRRRNR
jgi:SNF2 family DNA or RNA helicase